MKILHSGDWHGRDKDYEEFEKCLCFLVQAAKNECVNLAVLPGDIFDSRDIKLDSLSAKLVIKKVSELADICPVAIAIGTPSHDGLAAEVLIYAKGEYPVSVAIKPEQLILFKGNFYGSMDGCAAKPDAVISLVPQPTKQFFQTESDIASSNAEIGQAMSALFAGFGARAAEYNCPHILGYHGSISGAKLSTGQILTGMDIEVSIDQLYLSNADLILCDHIHLPQELAGNVFYSGSLYANNWGENHKHGFYIHEIEAA
ncbi:MAG: hypothetical protein PHS93_10075 [Candidatus Omnitrophica bacterium]|jgi:DNA repair exonuclease SbcCD nuclease subunit|nr:hypothetical protein [Candidatus Omnitrophota bacterium]